MADAKCSSRFRFTDEIDTHLAREVYGLNPYEDPRRWATIQVNMIQITGKCISIRTIRERMMNLVKKWLTKTKSMEGKSGVEIQVTELDDLLQQISELMSEFSNKEKKKCLNIPNKTSYSKGFEAREQSCSSFLNEQKDTATTQGMSLTHVNQDQDIFAIEQTNFKSLDAISEDMANEIEVTESNENIEEEEKENAPPIKSLQDKKSETRRRSFAQMNILSPTRKRPAPVRQNTIEYLAKKNERIYEIRKKEIESENELRKRELNLQERKLSLEQEKHELDSFEKKRRLEIEEQRVQMEARRVEMEEERMKLLVETFNNQQQLIKIIFEKLLKE